MNQSATTKASRMMAFKDIDLYPVVSSEFTNNRSVIEVVKEIAAGGAKIVQLREKHRSKREIYELALSCRAIIRTHQMLLIINDHPDVALAVGADGVHLGQDDLPLAAARRIAGELIIGCSTHNLAEAKQAEIDGADYINIGPVYHTATKEVGSGAIGIAAVRDISTEIELPFTVMGGIKTQHIPALLTLGVRRIAMVTEITRAENIRQRTMELRRLWQGSASH